MTLLKKIFLGLLFSSILFASDCECKCECSEKNDTNGKIDIERIESSDKNFTIFSKKYIKDNINYIDTEGNTLLHRAVINKDIGSVEKLLKEDLNINHRNNRGQTPLHLATINNSLNIVELLINHNAKITLFDIYGYSALYYANYLKFFKIANYLEHYGASVEIKRVSKKTKLDNFISNFNNEGFE